ETPGGNRDPVRYFASYLFEKGTLLLKVITRGVQRPVEVTTVDDVHGRRRPDVPVYVLTSRRTASAGEMFAFSLKMSHRATIVGERTAGAGHSVRFTPRPHGFFMLVPISRNVDPRTGAEWEGEGVAPDVDVSADRALDVALERIRRP